MAAEWVIALDACLKRIRRWQPPPATSYQDWIEEAEALAAAAAWQAVQDFDPSRNVPLSVFVRHRVLSAALLRYRREWVHALHRVDLASIECLPSADADTRLLDYDRLYRALYSLREADRKLLSRLFWTGSTEAEVAGAMHMTQQAVNKRKRIILEALRQKLADPDPM